MKIELTKNQYRDLLLSVIIGEYIREAVDEQNGKDIRNTHDMENYLMSLAKDFDSEDMVENFEGEFLVPSDKVIKEYHDHYIEEFEEESFWHNLITRLGQRDFDKNATKAELEKVKKNEGWLTDVIDTYYEKYENEFEKNGVGRLGIDETKK